MRMNEHQSHCGVWDWKAGEKTLNNAKPCTCGFREQVAEAQALMRSRNRALRPLNMTDEEFLRSLRIKPEET